MLGSAPAQLVGPLGVGLALDDLQVLFFLTDDGTHGRVTAKGQVRQIPGRSLHQRRLSFPLELLSCPLENITRDCQHGPAVSVVIQFFLDHVDLRVKL